MNEELRQQLWDLLYGLLEPDEAAALKVRITSDPEVARLYADISLQKELVADAARVDVGPMSFKVPGRTVVQPAKTATIGTIAAASAPRKASAKRTQSQSWASTAVGLTAIVLTGIVITALWQRPAQQELAHLEVPAVAPPAMPMGKNQFAAIQDQSIITEVRGPQTIVPGMTNHFSLQARTADGQPVAAGWNVRYIDQAGAERYSLEIQTDAAGNADVEIPGTALRTSGTLLVDRGGDSDQFFRTTEAGKAGADDAKNYRELAELAVPVTVSQETLAAHLEVDRPIARPGETVGFRTVVLGEQSQAISAAVPAEFQLFDSAGNPVPGTNSSEVTHFGVAAADAILPSNLADGVYELAVRSPDGAFAEQRTRLIVQRDGAAGLLAMSDQDRDRLAFSFRDQRGLATNSFEKGEAQQDQLAATELLPRKEGTSARKQMRFNESTPEQMSRNLKKQDPLADGGAPAGNDAPPEASAMAARTPALTAPVAPPIPAPAAPPAPGSGRASSADDAQAATANVLRRGNDQRDADKDSNLRPGNAAADAAIEAPAAGGFGGGSGSIAEKKRETSDLELALADGVQGDVAVQSALKIVADSRDGMLLELPAQQAGERLVQVTNERGEMVAQAEIPAAKRLKGLSQRVQISLPPEASGALVVALVDPAQPNEQLFVTPWQRPAQRWAELAFDGSNKDFAAGEEVELELTSKSEDGQPLPAVLGVRIVNDEFAHWMGDQGSLAVVNTAPGLVQLNAAVKGSSESEQEMLLNRQALAKQDSQQRFAETSPAAAKSSEVLGQPPGLDGQPPPAGNDAPDLQKAMVDGIQLPAEAAAFTDAKPADGVELNFVQSERHLVLLGRQVSAAPPAARGAAKSFDSLQSNAAEENLQKVDRAASRELANSLIRQRIVAKLLLAAGMLGVLAVGVACMLRVSLRPWAWIPAVAASVACIVIGAYRLPNIAQRLAERPVPGTTGGQIVAENLQSEFTSSADQPEKRELARSKEVLAAPLTGIPHESSRELLKNEASKAKAEDEKISALGMDVAPALDRTLAADAPLAAGGERFGLSQGEAKDAGKKEGLSELERSAAAAVSDRNGVSPSATSVPVTLFWNPRLITDDNGRATIRFQLPPQAGRYRVLVDAHADGRLGQAETLIVSQAKPGADTAAGVPADAAEVPPAAVEAVPAAEAAPARPPAERQP